MLSLSFCPLAEGDCFDIRPAHLFPLFAEPFREKRQHFHIRPHDNSSNPNRYEKIWLSAWKGCDELSRQLTKMTSGKNKIALKIRLFSGKNLLGHNKID